MPLPAATRLGPYEIISLLGAGGMGEVYRARDPILNRDIALKILPDLFALDRERVARFKREAQVLASLNHPHIAAIYGFEDANGLHALALELVDGPTLADRLTHGPIPVDEALPIARQIAEALEAAHEQGIIHRDLKPANIKLRPDGTVKVLDFGLAKTMEPVAPAAGTATASPTITSPAMTQMGLILGTAAYMSPEQARGQAADKRSDVWSFGAVLHEMLSGRRTFNGDDIADTLAAVLRQDVDWSVLPAQTPGAVRHLIARCLERNVKLRLRDIGEARIVLDRPPAPFTQPPGAPASGARRDASWRRGMAVVAGSIVIGAVGAITAWQLKPSPTPPVTRFPFMLPEGQTYPSTGGYGRPLAISPDGTQMVYVSLPRPRLYLRSMAELEAKPIVGTDLYDAVSEPVFSPDGRSIAFFAQSDRTLKRIAVTGGTAVTICPADSPTSGLSWGTEGIVFGASDGRIMRVSPDGGTPQVLLRAKDGEEVYGPVLLPDGQHVMVTIATGTARDRWDKARIVVQSITPGEAGEPRTLIEGGSDARYLPTGHLVYALSGIVYAVAFDVKRLEVYGPRVPVIQGVRRSASGLNGAVNFSVSNSGALAYIPGPLSPGFTHISLSDRKGGFELLKVPPGNYFSPRMSPDGRHIVVATDDGKEAIVYTHDLDDRPPRRLTYEGDNRFSIWAGDSTRVAFQSNRQGDDGIWWQSTAGGTAERLTTAEPGTSHTPESWSPKDKVLLYSVTKGSDVSLRIHSLADNKDMAFGDVHSSTPTDATFSPDGRWVAYTSTQASKTTVYVQPYPPTGDKFQLDAKGSDNPHEPAWSADGTELFYNAAPGRFESVSVRTAPVFGFGNSVAVTKRFGNNPPWLRRGYDVTPRGAFLGLLGVGQEGAAATGGSILFVLNWHEELKRLVPTK